MALLWIDGFDSYGTSTGSAPSPTGVVGRKYSTIFAESSMKIRAGRLGGYSLDIYWNGYIIPENLTTDATIVLGAAIMFRNLIENNVSFLRFMDGALNGFGVRIMSDGELAVCDGAGTQKKITTGLGLVANVWYYIEFKVVVNNTTGSYNLRVAETSVLSDSGLNTRADGGTHNYYTTFKVYMPLPSTITTGVDDLYCLDGSGSVNNDFLGNMRVVTLRPDEAGDSAQFTPDTGSNFARVNEEVCGNDSNYVEDATTGHEDLYNYGALTGISDNIKGIMVCTDCRETDATSFIIKTVCKPSTTDRPDAGQSVGSTSYVTKRRILETNPDGTDPWDVTSINAAQFGVQVG